MNCWPTIPVAPSTPTSILSTEELPLKMKTPALVRSRRVVGFVSDSSRTSRSHAHHRPAGPLGPLFSRRGSDVHHDSAKYSWLIRARQTAQILLSRARHFFRLAPKSVESYPIKREAEAGPSRASMVRTTTTARARIGPMTRQFFLTHSTAKHIFGRQDPPP